MSVKVLKREYLRLENPFAMRRITDGHIADSRLLEFPIVSALEPGWKYLISQTIDQ